jgi:hypothetical protein
MRVVVAAILGISLAANGLIMLMVPAEWYAAVPGVTESGPLNAHFVRDIGTAYLVCGGAFGWFALRPAARPAALAGAAFLSLHAIVHLWDAAAGREHAHQLVIDLPMIFLPALLAVWIACPPPHADLVQEKESDNDQMVSAALDR